VWNATNSIYKQWRSHPLSSRLPVKELQRRISPTHSNIQFSSTYLIQNIFMFFSWRYDILKRVACLVVFSMLVASTSAPSLICAQPMMQQDACLTCPTSRYYAHGTACYVVYRAETCDNVETVGQPWSSSPCPVAAPSSHAILPELSLARLCMEVVAFVIAWWARR
jgi:hypothetical protein